MPDAPWFPKDIEHWSVRWAWCHLIQQLAGQAGHGDIIRETLDGGTMYPLVAAAEGMGDLGFLQPWTPSEPGFTTGVSTVVYFAPEHRADGTGSVIAYWQVDDAAAAYERLLGLGATSQWPPRDFGAGYVGASVVDPFGNVLGVMQRPLG